MRQFSSIELDDHKLDIVYQYKEKKYLFAR